MTTDEILHKLPIKCNNGAYNIYIPTIQPIEGEDRDIILDPYLLGVFLRDGHIPEQGVLISCAEHDLLEKIKERLKPYDCFLTHRDQYDYSICGAHGHGYHNVQHYVGHALKQLGLRGTNSHTKFIPKQYLMASVNTKLQLLQGLIDTDGYCQNSSYEFILASHQLILDIQFLCESLGFTAVYSEKRATCNEKDCGIVYRLRIKTSAAYPKIHTTLNKDSRWKKGQTSARRTIREIIPTGEYGEMTCIEVASPNHLFVTEHCIVTHNTKTLISAILTYRYEYINAKICAITFTRAARKEMEERLENCGIRNVDVTTIHVWSRNLLSKLEEKYNFKVHILTDAEIKDILSMLVSFYNREKPRNRRIAINIGVLFSWVTGNKQMDVTDNYRRVLSALEERYIQYKSDNNLYDFSDYPNCLYDYLIKYDERISSIDALFVDEFQDIDPVQYELFKLVDCDKKFFIGDAWQSIYMFRNADGAAFEKLEDFDRYNLWYNYRSYQIIVDYACTVYRALEDDYMGHTVADVPFAKECNVICHRGNDDGSVFIIDSAENGYYINNKREITRMRGYRDLKFCVDAVIKDAMILCRTNKQVKALQEYGLQNVSTVHQAKGLEYDNVIYVDTPMRGIEDLNVAYVALTRARNKLCVIPWSWMETYVSGVWNAY